MSTKKSFIRSKLDKRLKFLDRLFRFLMLCMLIIVLYDSFVHLTPLYYYLFFVAGLYLGKLFKMDMKVQHDKQSNIFHLRTGWFYIALSLLLLAFRYMGGKYILESFHIIWATDALYLLFLGIYRAKWKGVIKQIDEIIYSRVSNTE